MIVIGPIDHKYDKFVYAILSLAHVSLTRRVLNAVPDLKVPQGQPAQRTKQQVEEEADFKALEEELAFN